MQQEGAAAAPATAVAPSTAVASGFPHREEHHLSFLNRKGERLVGVLLDMGATEVVVLAHGYVANSTMCQFPQLASKLAEAGISSFRFDHPCAVYTQSERHGPMLMGNHEDEVADMACAVDFLRSRGKKVVCLLGHSKGGTNSVMFASRHHDVPKIVNLAGRFKCRDGTLQRFGGDILDRLAAAGPAGITRKEAWGEWTLTEADFLDRVNLPMERMARSIPPSVRMLCLQGTADKTIPWQESELCASLVPNSELVLIEGGDHNFTQPAAAEAMIQAVVDFVLSK